MFAKTLIKKLFINKICIYKLHSKAYFHKVYCNPRKKNICFTAAFAPVQRNDVV